MFKSLKNHKSQTEVIVTVLLVLIGIIAVGLVSAWIINMVRSNLQGTECFNTADQIKVDLGDYTYFSASSNRTYVSISRGAGDFNLTGFIITVSGAGSSQTYNIKDGATGSASGVLLYPNSVNLVVPGLSGLKTYNLSYTAGEVKKVKVVPIILTNNKEKVCEQGTFETEIPSR
jgi:UDP-N-acetylmuramyl pentapeptide phosphotransferase/UDP-N-acetylglucosamine-1-phosphate transferase